jgi:hypothetical protein
LFNKLLHEPLLHFLLIGAALFILYDVTNEEVVDDDRRIVITEADIDRQIALWERKWQRLPTQTELEGLIDAQIREEVLYREALAMGLDENDTIVRRRLAQKVEFISSEISDTLEPTESELSDYLVANPDKFEIPGRVSFLQVYLNVDQHGDQVEADAQLLLSQLKKAGADADVSTAGDPFMFGERFEDITEFEISRIFGREFTEAVIAISASEWQGPVRSGYGLHLVYISSKTDSRLPSLEEVRDRVSDEWMAKQRNEMDELFYQELRKRYDISIERPVSGSDKLAKQ